MNNVVTMLLSLSQELKTVKAYLEVFHKTRIQNLSEAWLDAYQVMTILKISKRTLQTLRDNGSLAYSKINQKIYYKTDDVEHLLESNYTQNKKQ